MFQDSADFESGSEASDPDDGDFVPKSCSSIDSSNEDLLPFFDQPESKFHAVPWQSIYCVLVLPP